MTRADEARAQLRLEAWRTVLNSPEGWLVLADLLNYCGLFRSSLGGSTDQMLTMEGKREIALSVQRTCLDADRAAYVRLLSAILEGRVYDGYDLNNACRTDNHTPL